MLLSLARNAMNFFRKRISELYMPSSLLSKVFVFLMSHLNSSEQQSADNMPRTILLHLPCSLRLWIWTKSWYEICFFIRSLSDDSTTDVDPLLHSLGDIEIDIRTSDGVALKCYLMKQVNMHIVSSLYNSTEHVYEVEASYCARDNNYVPREWLSQLVLSDLRKHAFQHGIQCAHGWIQGVRAQFAF